MADAANAKAMAHLKQQVEADKKIEAELRSELRRVQEERNHERLVEEQLVKDLKHAMGLGRTEAKHVHELEDKLKHMAEADAMEIQHLRDEKARESRSKLGLAGALAETQHEMEKLRRKIVGLQVDNQQKAEQIERLEVSLAKAEQGERERIKEVRLHAARLREVEASLQRLLTERDADDRLLHPPSVAPPGFKKVGFQHLDTWVRAFLGAPGREGQPSHLPQIEQILSIEGNTVCCDCGSDTVPPTWVSTAFGCLLCTSCASVHRSFGSRVTRVRSLTLDRWEEEELASLAGGQGNKRCNARLLASLPSHLAPPVMNDQEFRQFLRDKYVVRRWEAGYHDPLEQLDEGGSPPGTGWLIEMVTRLQEMVAHMGQSGEAQPELPHELSDNAALPEMPARQFVPKVRSWQTDPPLSQLEDPGPPELRPLPDDELAAGPAQRAAISEVLPFAYKTRNWIRVFSSVEHGSSIRSLYHECAEKAPTVLLFKTTEGVLLGGFSTGVWADQRYYHGTGETVVFRFEAEPAEEVSSPGGTKRPVTTNVCDHWGWSGINDYFVLSHAGMIAFGGGTGPAFCVDESLARGSTGACETFGSPPLTTPTDFTVARLEVYEFED